MPKSALTGTQKKAMKTLASEIRKAGGSRKEALRIAETYLPGQARYKSTERKLEGALKQQEKYLSSSKQPYKQLEKFLPGGELYQKPDFARESKQGLQLAREAFAPIEKEAVRNFQQQTVPTIFGQYGREAGAGSSALNQALAASATNLQSQLGSQLGQLAVGYGSDISRMNLAERGRQQEQQYGAARDIFGAKRAADVGYGQARQDIVSYLNQLGLGGAQALQKAGLPQTQGGFTAPYLQKQQQGGTSGMGGLLIGGGLGALGSYLGTEAGAAAIGSLFSSREVKENIEDFDMGLEEVRNMNVKKYDYTIPVQGRQKGRIGLIAEEMPEEIQDSVEGIKAVDVYGLVAILINAIKDLDSKVKTLEAKNV